MLSPTTANVAHERTDHPMTDRETVVVTDRGSSSGVIGGIVR